ncbi:MAG: hypothetical protein QF586_01415 [Arenicellales bacterium]|jgi:hypothetical protein|nr:hypothetical protein [Arenicellales bacterium]MDP6433780.1 hypothetical protein [Arenicellales bacterium]MDP6672816.1 hypothetical protein [Arenicellales bacterium]MDP6724786.1 hypothetical protein [Arenicellales bacterium]MDP7155138.1 hypothetical protein [Arenicellales bacterium]|tara:strand:- start:27 stop:320 length:294 start_codon:yes stop_codon:yes gene_type:complete
MLKLFGFKKPHEPSQARRLFFKGMATAGVAIASITGLGAAMRGGKTDRDYQAAYDRDVVPGDKILQQNGFEEIAQQEKDEMVQMFIDDYENKKTGIS